MKLGVVGSRDWKDFDFMKRTIDETVKEFPSIDTLISGGAKGVDQVAADYGRQIGLKVLEYLPDFSHGYSPGEYHKRNERIAKDSDLVLAFQVGQSRGTQSTINFCRKYKTEVRIYKNG